MNLVELLKQTFEPTFARRHLAWWRIQRLSQVATGKQQQRTPPVSELGVLLKSGQTLVEFRFRALRKFRLGIRGLAETMLQPLGIEA